MRIVIEYIADSNETYCSVEERLQNVFEMARNAAVNNAHRTTTTFDGGKSKCHIDMDNGMIELLQMDVEHAEMIAKENPCSHCCDEFICMHECDALSKYHAAQRTILQARAYCNTDCEQYRRGTCPFPGDKTKECPKYKFE